MVSETGRIIITAKSKDAAALQQPAWRPQQVCSGLSARVQACLEAVPIIGVAGGKVGLDEGLPPPAGDCSLHARIRKASVSSQRSSTEAEKAVSWCVPGLAGGGGGGNMPHGASACQEWECTPRRYV